MPNDPITYDPHSPFSAPSRRWDAAGAIAAGDRCPAAEDDPLVQAAVAYRRGLGKPDNDGADARPLIAAAQAIHYEDGPTRWEIEARLLTDESIEQIAAKTGVAADVVRAFETVFFDVRPRLAATVWILANVLGPRPPEEDQEPEESAIWKRLAYQVGPAAIDIMIADYLGRTEPELEGRAALAQALRLTIQLELTPPGARTEREILQRMRQLRPEAMNGLEEHEQVIAAAGRDGDARTDRPADEQAGSDGDEADDSVTTGRTRDVKEGQGTPNRRGAHAH